MTYFFITFSIGFWIILFFYWIIEATRTRGIKNEIVGLSKLLISGLVLYIPLLLPNQMLIYQPNFIIRAIGLLISISGYNLCYWSRKELAQNWSGKVAIQENHQLIKSGPYKIIRHPIYSGVLVLMLGTSIIIGSWLAFIWTFFCFFGLYRKGKQEEELLMKEFGEAYNQYRKETKMLIPFVL